MAKFDTIKTAIDANINTNGNQAITGSVMNSVLKQMVDSTDAELTELESEIEKVTRGVTDFSNEVVDGVLQYDYYGNFSKGQKVTIISDASNPTIYFFQFREDESWLESISIAPGETKEIELQIDTHHIKVFRSGDTPINFSINVEGRIESISKDVASLDDFVSREFDNAKVTDSKIISILNKKVDTDSINLIDPNKATLKAAINKHGEIEDIPYDTFAVSDFIEVKGGDQIQFNGFMSLPEWYPGVVYDKNMSILRVLDNKSYTHQEGDAYVRLSFQKEMESLPFQMMANYGDSLLPYTPYNPQTRLTTLEDKVIELSEELKNYNGILPFEDKVVDGVLQYDYYGNFIKGQKVTISSASTNPIIYFFQFREDESWLESISINPGETKVIELEIDTHHIKVFRSGDAPINFSIHIEGRISLAEDSIKSMPGSEYIGKKLVTIGDSYCATGQWQKTTAQMRGFSFDEELNKYYSVAGSTTISGEGECGQYRARRLAKDGLIVPDVIIIENVNDGNLYWSRKGKSEDEPYMMGERTNVIAVQDNADAAISYVQNNLSSILNGVNPEHGHLIGVPYSTGNTASKLLFTSAPKNDGVLAIRYGSEGVRYININASDSIKDVVDKITEYAWNRYDIIADANSVTFTPVLAENYMPDNKVTILDNSCNISVDVANNQPGARYWVMTYPEHDMSNWLDSSAWVHIDTITLWSAYKGLFNYLAEHFPNAEIYFMHPIAYNVNVNSADMLRADGSLDTERVKEKEMFAYMRDFQREASEYCNVTFLDIVKYAGIYLQNVANYFPPNNYHPNNKGYERWGIAVAKMIL